MNCFKWINCLWKHLFCGSYMQDDNGGTSILSLPNDIMSDILSRLPAQSVQACRQAYPLWLYLSSTPYFAEIHLMNSAPILLGQERLRNWSYEPDVMFVFEGFGKNPKVTKVRLKGLEVMHECCLQLYASCNGFLLFGLRTIERYVIYNPLTLENFRIFEEAHRICGFFFHEQERDYKLLLCKIIHKDRKRQYYIYSMSTTNKRILTSSPYFPLRYSPQYEIGVVVSGALFWIVRCLTDSGISYECSKSIMMFDVKAETFHVMPHPGSYCTHRLYRWIDRLHEQMVLLEVNGKLTCINLCEMTMEVWVLENVANWMWVKNFVVDIGRRFDNFAMYNSHPVVAMENNKLLINWPNKGFFCCNLGLNSFRKIKGSIKMAERCDFCVTKFTGSFISNVFSDSLKGSLYKMW